MILQSIDGLFGNSTGGGMGYNTLHHAFTTQSRKNSAGQFLYSLALSEGLVCQNRLEQDRRMKPVSPGMVEWRATLRAGWTGRDQ